MIDILEDVKTTLNDINNEYKLVECYDIFESEKCYVISYIDDKGKLRYVSDPKRNNGYYSSFFIKHAIRFKKKSSAELYKSKMTFGNPKIEEISINVK